MLFAGCTAILCEVLVYQIVNNLHDIVIDYQAFDHTLFVAKICQKPDALSLECCSLLMTSFHLALES